MILSWWLFINIHLYLLSYSGIIIFYFVYLCKCFIVNIQFLKKLFFNTYQNPFWWLQYSFVYTRWGRSMETPKILERFGFWWKVQSKLLRSWLWNMLILFFQWDPLFCSHMYIMTQNNLRRLFQSQIHKIWVKKLLFLWIMFN